jgi:hypothetical protein
MAKKCIIKIIITPEGPGRYRFRCESWATNLIIGEEQKKRGLSDRRFSSVTPVRHWLIKKFLSP